jgi:hypothetical protein
VVPPDSASPLLVDARQLAERLPAAWQPIIEPRPDPSLPLLGPVRLHWPPVHLPSIPRSLLAPWTSTAGLPSVRIEAALAWLAQREPLLVRADRHPVWGAQAATPATLIALAAFAAEGRRVVLRLPSGSDLAALAPACELIGRMQLPFKLICDAEDLPLPIGLLGLGRWWVVEAGRESDPVLAWALAGEEPVLLALADAAAGDPWPADEAWEPGAPRWLAGGSDLTLVCTARDAAAALAARELLRPAAAAGVLQLTALAPLPAYELATAPAPLLVLGDELARTLVSATAGDPARRPRLAPRRDPGLIASAARQALG